MVGLSDVGWRLRRLTVWAAVSGLCCAASVVPAPAYAQEELRKPTARDMYVACTLLVNETDVPKRAGGRAEPFSAAQCGLAAVATITYREGKNPKSKFNFCLPKTAEVTDDPARAMAYAYLDFYERVGSGNSAGNGVAGFALAMADKWPCP